MAIRRSRDLEETVAKALFDYPWAVPALPRSPQIAYHLHLAQPIKWTQARTLQNTLIRAYQTYHHRPTYGRILPPTFITFRFTPTFTYGRKDPRPETLDKRMLEGLREVEGYRPETRLAWARDHGWYFFGPGQVQCWMVADLTHWHWEISDVELLMNSALSSVISHYLPLTPSEIPNYNPSLQYRSITHPPPTPGTPLFNELAHLELWQNNYGVISHGCALNVRKDQILWTNRISRYGFPAPQVTSLDVEGWTISENHKALEARLVGELCTRMGLQPEVVDSDTLGRILDTKVPKPETLARPTTVRERDKAMLLNNLRLVKEGSSWARQQVYVKWFPWEIKNRLTHPVFVKGWGQYIRKGMLPTQEVEVVPGDEPGEKIRLKQRHDVGWRTFEADDEVPVESEEEAPAETGKFRNTRRRKARPRDRSEDTAPSERPPAPREPGARSETLAFIPPPELIYQTIEWSSTDFMFNPHHSTSNQDIVKRITFSPSQVSDLDFLDAPTIPSEKKRLREMIEKQKRVIAEMGKHGEAERNTVEG